MLKSSWKDYEPPNFTSKRYTGHYGVWGWLYKFALCTHLMQLCIFFFLQLFTLYMVMPQILGMCDVSEFFKVTNLINFWKIEIAKRIFKFWVSYLFNWHKMLFFNLSKIGLGFVEINTLSSWIGFWSRVTKCDFFETFYTQRPFGWKVWEKIFLPP